MFDSQEDAELCQSKSTTFHFPHPPQRICPHDFHKIVCGAVEHRLRSDADACICEEDIQPAILLYSLVADALYVSFLSGVDFTGMNVDIRIELVDFSFVCLQVSRGVVADEDSLCSIARKLMCRSLMIEIGRLSRFLHGGSEARLIL